MILKSAKIINDISKYEEEPTRNGYGAGVLALGKENEKVVVLCADLTDSTRSKEFKEQFPDRFVQMGVHEQLLAALAAGMALEGKIPGVRLDGN